MLFFCLADLCVTTDTYLLDLNQMQMMRGRPTALLFAKCKNGCREFTPTLSAHACAETFASAHIGHNLLPVLIRPGSNNGLDLFQTPIPSKSEFKEQASALHGAPGSCGYE